MKKKIISLLAAAAMSMAIIAVPFSANAAANASTTLGGVSATANVTKGTNNLSAAYATASTSFGVYANSIEATVPLKWRAGYNEYTSNSIHDYREMSTYASATVSSNYTGSIALAGYGWHVIGWNSMPWNPSTSC